jgi:hypothetical protein
MACAVAGPLALLAAAVLVQSGAPARAQDPSTAQAPPAAQASAPEQPPKPAQAPSPAQPLAPLPATPVLGEPVELQDLPPEQLEVERVQAKKPKLVTLRFLRENREFLRAQLDQLRLVRRDDLEGEAGLLDPRFAMYREMLQQLNAARDTVRAEQESLQRREVLQSVTELGGLEAQLDLMEKLLADESARLARLEADFVGRQQTALVVLVRGCPAGATPAELLLTEEGQTVRVPMSADQWAALRKGGIAQIYHAFIEPREHVLEVALSGEGWPARTAHSLSLEPSRDRLTFLELDLAAASPAQPSPDIRSSLWVK